MQIGQGAFDSQLGQHPLSVGERFSGPVWWPASFARPAGLGTASDADSQKTGRPISNQNANSEKGPDEREHQDRDPHRALFLASAGTAAPPRWSHLHPRRLHRRGEQQPDPPTNILVTPRRSRSSSIPSGPPTGTSSSSSSRSTDPIRARGLSAPITAPKSSVRATSSARSPSALAAADASGLWPGKVRDQDQRGWPLLGGRGRRPGVPPALPRRQESVQSVAARCGIARFEQAISARRGARMARALPAGCGRAGCRRRATSRERASLAEAAFLSLRYSAAVRANARIARI
jgi:hypothetical protein